MSNWVISSGGNLYLFSANDTPGTNLYTTRQLPIPVTTGWNMATQTGINITAPFKAIGTANSLLYLQSSQGTITPFYIGFQVLTPLLVSWQMNSSGQITFDTSNIYTGCGNQNGQLAITTTTGTVLNTSASFGVPIATNPVIFPYVYQIMTGAVGTA